MRATERTKSDAIRSAMEAFECDTCGARRSFHIALEEHRINSTIAVAVCDSCGRRIFAKDVHAEDDEPAHEIAEREFRLERLLFERSTRTPDFDVVRPIALHGSVVITEFVDGGSIPRIEKFQNEAADRTFERIGRWLAEFHLTLACPDGRVDFSDKCSMLKRRSFRLSASHPIRRAIERLESDSRRFSDKLFHRAQLHGDVKLDNFLMAGERVFGVDILCRYVNLPEHDLAQFFGQLRLSVRTGSKWRGETDVERLVASVLRGYTERSPVDLEALEWLRNYFRIHFWLTGRERGLLWLWSVRPLLKDLAIQA